ncbi:AraC family transcriptional regulator [Saccharopolyspora sp. NPDC050642]|uniref:AraC family transcriptional regulator n=1 Tax=Saccharopolyspora sp. NPDC050642 TaxID=3157099 RepID=UPI0033DDC4C6
MGALERYTVLRGSDVDEFRASVSRFLTPHLLTPVGRCHSSVTADLAQVSLGPVSLVYGRNAGAELGVRLLEQVSYYDVNLALAGRNLLSCAGDEVLLDGATAGIISPKMVAEMRLSDGYSQLHVRIERHALERHLEGLLGHLVPGPIRFRPRMDLHTPAAASWSQGVRLLVQDLDQPAGLASTVRGASSWASFLMNGLLLAQPHDYSEQLEQRRVAAHRPAPVRKALDLIDDQPDADLSVDRLARAAGVTPRSLQRHFRTHVGVPPHEYVQRVRLARVHDDLRSAQRGSGVTVADVALRWGFTHVSRFAALYQRHYGVAPSVTLREPPESGHDGMP